MPFFPPSVPRGSGGATAESWTGADFSATLDVQVAHDHDDLCLSTALCPTNTNTAAGYPMGGDVSSLQQLGSTCQKPAGVQLSAVQLVKSASFPGFAGPFVDAIGVQQPVFDTSICGPTTYNDGPFHGPPLAGGEEDSSISDCDSDCGAGEICHGTACADDDASLCDDEDCVKAEEPISSEDADAAAALASFVTTDLPPATSPFYDHSPLPSDRRHGLWGPDKPRVRRVLRAPDPGHNPEEPSCTAGVCPIDDPSFLRCRVRQPSPLRQNLFDNIDISQIGYECGVKLSTLEDMYHHLWKDHQTAHGQDAQDTPSSRESSSAAADALFGTRPISSEEPECISPDSLPPGLGSFSAAPHRRASGSCAHAAAAFSQTGSSTPDGQHRCQWCETPGCLPCGVVFDSCVELNDHVVNNHTLCVNRDVGERFCCGWVGCPRQANQGRGGFASRKKLERHMVCHTGCELHRNHLTR